MAFFKKREKTQPDPAPAPIADGGARIVLLGSGSGCASCVALERAVHEAVAHMGLNEPVLHITDLRRIAAYGVMSVPALVVDGEVVSVGRALRPDEVERFLAPLQGK